MSRSGYTEDNDDQWALIRWRGAVKSAMRGKRGQAFLRELLAALDAMSVKRLIANDLVFDGDPATPYLPYEHEDIIVGGDVLVDGRGNAVHIGEVCALGYLGQARGLDMRDLDPEEPEFVADAFGVNDKIIREIVYTNDEGAWGDETPEKRWIRVRAWVAAQIVAPK